METNNFTLMKATNLKYIQTKSTLMKTKTTLSRAGLIVAIMLLAFWSTVSAQPADTADFRAQRMTNPIEILNGGFGQTVDTDIDALTLTMRNISAGHNVGDTSFGIVLVIDGTIIDTITKADWVTNKSFAGNQGKAFDFANVPLTDPGLYEIKWYPVPVGSGYHELNTGNDTGTVTLRIHQWIAPVANAWFEDFNSGQGYTYSEALAYQNNWMFGNLPAIAGSGDYWYRSLSPVKTYLPLGEISYVQLPTFDFTGFDFDPVIEMDVLYETTSGYGIALYYSTNGVDYFPVGGYNTTDIYAQNWYNTPIMNFIGGPGWSGSSNGWETVSHTLTGMAGENTVYLRMAFVGEQGSPTKSSPEDVAFDNINIYESFGVFIDADASPVVPSDNKFYSTMRGQTVTLTADVRGGTPPFTINWYSMKVDAYHFWDWWFKNLSFHFPSSPALPHFDYWVGLATWTCDSLGQGPSITVTPDSSTFYYAVVNNDQFTPCDGSNNIAWPYDGNSGGGLKAGPVFVYGAAAIAVLDSLTVEAEFDGHNVCDTAVTPAYAFPSGGMPPYTYAWSPTATLASGATDSIAYSVANVTTTYTVTVTDFFGNTATDDVTISVVSGYPFVDIVPNNALLCEDDSVMLTAYGGSGWSWYTVPPGAATFSDSNGVNTWVIPTGTVSSFDVWVDMTSSCGNASATMQLEIKPRPAAPTMVSWYLEACDTDPVIDLFASVSPSPGGGTFSGPGVVNGLFDPSTTDPPSASFPAPFADYYFITYTIKGANGCTADSAIFIDLFPNPESYTDILGVDTVCLNDIESYDLDSLAAYTDTVEYAVTGGTITNVSGTFGETIEVQWDAVGVGVITATIYNPYCTGTISYTVIVNPLPVFDIVSFAGATQVADTFIYCESEIDSLYADITPGMGSGFGGYEVNWLVFDYPSMTLLASYNNEIGLPEAAAVNTLPLNTDIQYYLVYASVTDSSTGCEVSDSVFVKVFNTPEGDFFAPGFDTIFACIDACEAASDLSIYGADSFNIYDSYGNIYTSAGQIFPAVCWDTIYSAPDTVTFYAEFFLNGCMGMDSAVLVLWELPEVYNLTHDGDLEFCWNTAGPELYMDNSDGEDSYDLYRDGALVATVAGDGDSITFGNWNIPGEYWVVATDTLTGCVNYMSDTLTLISDTIVIDLISEFDTVCPTFTSRMTVDFLSDTSNYGPFTFAWNPVGSKFTPDGYGEGIARPGSVTTLYSVTVTGTDPLCTATDNFELAVWNGSIASIGDSANGLANVSDTSICLGSSIDLQVSWTLGDAPITSVTWNPMTGVTPDNHLNNPVGATFSTTAATTYTVTIQDANGCVAHDSVNVFVNVAPIVKINNDIPAAICPGSDTTLVAGVTFGTGPYTYTWSPATGDPSVVYENNDTLVVSPAVTTTYYLTVYDAGLNCYGYASLTVEVIDAPVIVSMGEPYFTCQWGEINLAPVITGSPANFAWTQVAGPAALPPITATQNPTIAMNGILNGLYQVELAIVDGNGCEAIDSAYINVTIGPSISAGADQYICEGTTVTLTGQGGNGTTSYSWYSDTSYGAGSLIANYVSIDVTPSVTTTYYLRVNNDSCGVATSQVTVYVHPATPVFFDGLAAGYCEVEDPITLTNVSPVGGTFSGEGVDPVTGVFDPGAVTTKDAPITILYEYADSTVYPLYPVCVYSHSMTTTVWSTPIVTIGTVAPVCADAAAFPVTDFAGMPAGGSYEIDGNPVAGNVDPATLGAGIFDVWYYYTDANGCSDSAMTTFEVYALPMKYDLIATSPTNAGHYCDGDSADITLDNSEVDVTYDLYLKTSMISTATFQNSVAGTGTAISFGQFASNGFYYVLATNDTSGCSSAASDTVQLIQEELPQQFNLIVENGGHYCEDFACETTTCDGVRIGMYSTNREDKYFLYMVGNPAPVAEMNGTVPSGGAKWFPGKFTAAGDYYVMAVDTSTPANCPQWMLDTVTITIDPKPVVQSLSKDNVCQCPGEFTTISIAAAETDVYYVLYFGGVAVDTISGTTSFDPVNVVGTYTVVGYKVSNGTNVWNNPLFGVPASWETICVDTMGTIDVCEYVLVAVDDLRFYDQDPATPTTMTIDGGEEGYITVDVSGDYPGGAFAWEVSTDGGTLWNTVVDGGIYSGATTDSLVIDPVSYPSMQGYQYRFIVTGYCNADTSDVVTLEVRPDITLYAGEPSWAKSLDTVQCANTIEIPIYAENFDMVGSASLNILFDYTIMDWVGQALVDVHPALTDPGVIFQYGPGIGSGRVTVSIFSMTPINIGNDVLFKIPFEMPATGGYSTLEWDLVIPGANQVTDVATVSLKTTYVNGSVTGRSLPIPDVNITPNPICEGDELFLTANPYSNEPGGNPVIGIWQVPNNARGIGGYLIDNDTSLIMELADNGDYTYTATDRYGCEFDTTVTVQVNPLPEVFNVLGGGTACAGSAVEISLDGSQEGVKYYLMYNGSVHQPAGYPAYIINGTGGPITFGPVIPGNQILGSYAYTVMAIDTTEPTLCDVMMNGVAIVTITPNPLSFPLRVIENSVAKVSGEYCEGTGGLPVILGGSQNNVTYELWYSPVCCACPDTMLETRTGTGSTLSFGNQELPGYYFVRAINNTTGCESEMQNCVFIKINPLPTAHITGDAEICEGESTDLTVTFTGKAPFYVTINGVTYGPIATTSWSTTVTPPVGTTVYTISNVEDANLCNNTGTGSATVVVNPLPNAHASYWMDTYCVGQTIYLFGQPGAMSYAWTGPDGFTSTLQNPEIPNSTLANAGWYYLTVTNIVTGCVNVDSVEVVLNTLPIAIAIGDEVCVGDDITLTGSNSYGTSSSIVSYTWRFNGDTLTHDADTVFGPATTAMAGTYELFVVDGNGCTDDASATVVVHALPVADAGADQDICLGETAMLVATGGDLYYWSTGETTDTIYVMPTDTATYYVTVTELHGSQLSCESVDTVSVNVLPLPVPYELTQDGIYCFGCFGIPVNLVNSDLGIDYILYHMPLNSSVWSPVDTLAGVGGVLYFGDLEVPGTYKVLGVNSLTGCQSWMSNEILINLRPAPTANFDGDVDVCADECETLTVTLTGLTPFTIHYSDGSVVVMNDADLTYLGLVSGIETWTYELTVCGSTAPAYIGIDLVEDSVCFRTGDTAYINVLPLPVAYDVTGGGYYCNIGVPVGLAGSQIGVSYVLHLNGSPMDTIPGTGAAISFGAQTQLGTYTVMGINDLTGCTNDMNGYAELTGGNLPMVYDLEGDGFYCAGDSSQIWMNYSEIGVTYELLLNGISTGVSVAGTGGMISFGYVTAVGTYTVQGIDDVTSCISLMNGDVDVDIVPLPTANVSGSTTICSGDNAAITVTFTGTPPFSFVLNGISYSTSNYVWTNNFSPMSTTTYAVSLVEDLYCSNTGGDTALVTVSKPTAYTITGGGVYCEGGAGKVIGLNGSQIGVTYELYLNGVATGQFVAGSGAAISFGNQTAAGVYSIVGTFDVGGCSGNMTGTLTISINPLPMVFNVTGGDSCCMGCEIIFIGLDSTEANSNIRYELWRNGSLYNNPNFAPKYGTGAAIEWGYMTQAGTYTIRAVNEVTGCATFMNGSAVAFFFPEPAASIAGDDTLCYGETADITITFTAGTPPFSVLVFEDGDTLQYFNNIPGPIFTYTTPVLSAGVHTYALVEVADAECFATATGSATVVVNALPQVNLSMYDGYCVDAPADTLVMGYPMGGTYTINGNPAVVFDPAALGVGVHLVEYTYTDMNGCTNSASMDVEVYELPVCSVTGGTLCIDGDIITLATGMPAGGTYYVDGVATSTFDPAVYGVGGYELTYVYVDSNGCECSAMDSIFVTDLPVVTIDPIADVCANDAPVALTASPAGGVFSGSGVVGNTFDPTLVTPGMCYEIVYTISVGVCANSDTILVCVNTLPMDMPLVGDTLVCEFTNQDIGLGSTEAGITYQLYRNGNIINGQLITGTGSPMSFGTQSQAGTYTVYAENPVTGCGRFLTDNAVITWIPLPTVTTFGNGTHCTGDSTAVEFVFTGTPPFTLEYNINGADYVVSGIMTYSYTLEFLNLTTNLNITNVTIIDLTCYNDGNPVTITVLPATADVSIVGGGEYCEGEAGVTVGLDSTVVGAFYELYKDGVATGDVLVGNGTAMTFVGLQTAGTYTAIATASGSCQTAVLGSVVVVENPLPTVSAFATMDTICIGESTDLMATGADSYEWNTGDLTASITVSPTVTTTYTVTGTTTAGCEATADVTVVVNAAPVVTATASQMSICLGLSTDLTAAGAVSYEWSTGETTAIITVNPSVTTTYYVTGTDANGCTAEAMVEVEVFTNPVVDVTPSAAEICLGDDVTLTAGGADTYEWNTGDMTAAITVSPTSTTTYTVTGTVAGGCTAEASVTVTVNALPTVEVTPASAVICEGDDVSLTASGAVSYLWSNGATTATIIVSPMATTTYTVTGTSAEGCENVASATVTVSAPQAVDAGLDQTITGGGSATLTATVTGGSGDFAYYWTPGGETTASIVVSPTDTTTYYVEVTDNISGCVVSDMVTVNVISVVGDLAGVVTYKNAAGTPMTNTPVVLMKNGAPVASTMTDANGAYTFTGVYAGSYTVVAEPTKAWGGANSNDALLILKHSVSLELLSGLNLAAADVTGEGFVNATDALQVAQRFVTLINSFAAGDWVSDATPVTISSAGLVSGVDVQVLCMGDVNGSFTPAAKATVEISSNGTMEINSFETVEVPVSVSKDMTVGAISLVLDYPEDAVEVEGVLLGTKESSSLLYTDYNGVLRISWYDMNARQTNAGEALVTLKLRIKDLSYVLSDVIEITTTNESQIGDASATVQNVNLTMPKLTVATESFSIANYPNPFSNTTQFKYSLPVNGKVSLKVYNVLGEQVSVLLDNQAQEAGNYKVDFRANNLSPGTYTYRFEVKGAQQFSKTGMMVLTR